MKWVTVDAMRLVPNRCIACGSTPRDDTKEGRPNMEAYFCEGVDYDFGKALYLCGNCVQVLGLLRGMVDVQEHERVKRENKSLKVELEQLQEEHGGLQARVDRMIDGVKAKKEVKETRPKKKVTANA